VDGFDQLFNPEVVASIAEYGRLPVAFVQGLRDSDDWSFIIKIHSMVEAALNQLVVNGIGDDRLLEVIMRLDTSDPNRGKIAFVKALNLLPKDARAFVSMLSKLRNELVHDLSHFDFSLSKWLKEMDANQLDNLIKCLDFSVEKAARPDFSNNKQEFREMPPRLLKAIIMKDAVSITFIAGDKAHDRFVEPLEREEKRLRGLVESYEAGKKSGSIGEAHL
jgi:hypothetical protein